MKTRTLKNVAIEVACCMALCAAAFTCGCQQTPQEHQVTDSAESASQAQQTSEPTAQDTNDKAKAGYACGMPEWITVSSENYTNLGWKGTVEIHVDSSCLYDNYKSALKANPGLKASDGAVKDGPVLVCKISMEDSGATSDKSDSAVFGADFMYLGPDRAPVQFMVPFGDSSRKDASDNLFDFALAKDGYTEITVGFSVPQTWLNDSVANPQEWHKGADANGFDYIAFGGDPEQYCVSAEGVVPTTDYIQLATTVVDTAQ